MVRVRRGTWLLAILAAALLIAAGCQRGEEPTTTGVSTIKSGKLTVGSDIPFEPFEFEKDGKLTGFDVEMVEEIARRLGLTVEWVDTDFDTIFTQLAAARFDAVASATTITDERKKQVGFTDSYYASQQALTVNRDKSPGVKTTDDLRSGDTVAVQEGTTGQTWAQDNLASKGVQVRAFAEAPDTYTALEAGTVTGVIFDEPSAIAEAKKRPSLQVVQTIDTGERYGFAVNPRNAALLDAMNEALRDMISDGTYSKIYANYPDLPPGGDITKATTK